MIQTQSVLYTSITRMLTKNHLRCVLLVVCTIVNATLLAQNFQVAGGIPYFPAYTNTSYVTLSPIPTGAVIYDKSKSQLQLYNGAAWVSLCSANIPGTSNASASFRIVNGIPVLSVTNLSSPATAGATYLNTSGNIYVGDGSAWNTLGNYMNKTNVPTTNPARMGAVAGSGSALVIPVLSAAPVVSAAGAAYFDAATANLKVYNGTGWLTVGCNLPFATTVYTNGSYGTNGSLTGYYSYSQADGLPEGSSVYRWYYATNSSGSGKSTIGGATSRYYTIPSGNAGKYIAFGVMPVTNTGLTGNEVISSWNPIVWQCGEVLRKTHTAGSVAPVTVTIDYGTVSIGGICWITRNLGATALPSSINDVSPAATGWYWQYGFKRGYDRSNTSGWQSSSAKYGWSLDQDPCAILLGGSWHVPDASQFANLISNLKKDDRPAAFAGPMHIAQNGYIDWNQKFIDPDGTRWWSRTLSHNAPTEWAFRFWGGSWWFDQDHDEGVNRALGIRCCY